jgi:hypothetical protein
MKYFFLLALTGSLLTACTGNDAQMVSSAEQKQQSEAAMKDTANYTTIEWIDSTTKNMGKIQQGQTLEITWKFRNTGNKPLFVSEVRPGCGCTGAKGPDAPIAPGGTGMITATFNSENYPGTQQKSVFVMANNKNKKDQSQDILYFNVEVEPKK